MLSHCRLRFAVNSSLLIAQRTPLHPQHCLSVTIPSRAWSRSYVTRIHTPVHGGGISEVATFPEEREASQEAIAEKQQGKERKVNEPSKKDTAAAGAFPRLPQVQPSYEILGSALKRARQVRPTKGIANAAKRERNRGAKQLDTLTKELVVPLGAYLRSFPSPSHLHPFETSVLELTLGPQVYSQTLDRVNTFRKKLLNVGKNVTAQMSETSSRLEAEERLMEGYAKMEKLYAAGAHAVDALKEMTKTLRLLPVVYPDIPTVCLVGAPNVGKSSIVRRLSSGKPEVCNYPFTTRGIIMGHFFIDHQRYQVTDTPGLLWRKEEDRNRIERLTMAALTHLPCAVVFVHDLTGECGTTVEHQFALHRSLRDTFGNRPWLDVVSKADLLPPTSGDSKSPPADDSWEYYEANGPPGAVRVSAVTELGLQEMVSKVHHLMMRLPSNPPDLLLEDASNSVDSQISSSGTEGSISFYYPKM